MTLDINLENELLKSFTSGLQKIDTRYVYEWCADNIKLPPTYAINGRFNVELSPYLKKPMRDLTDNSIRQINLCCSTQTFKSGINEVFTPYCILQNPAPMLRIHQSDPAANTCLETRILPMLRNNDSIKLLLTGVKYNSKNGVLNMPTMFIKSCGTSENNLHGLSIKYAILDEVWLYTDKEVVDKVKARLTAFEKNYKLIITSQPDIEGSQLWGEYNKGNIFHYGWRCPSCQKLQTYEFNGEKNGRNYGLIWLPNNQERTLSYDERTNGTVLVCQHCFESVEDNEDSRISLVQNGDYIQIQNGNPTIASYSWPCFVNKDISFKKIATDYLEAKTEYRNTGLDEKLKLFRNQKLGLFWKRNELIDSQKLLLDTYNTNEKWLEESHRFLTIDVQQKVIYWLVTAWSNKVSEARLIDWGVCVGFDEINAVKIKYNIHPLCIGIDSGNDTVPIYKESVQRGEVITLKNGKKFWAQWMCLKGDGGKLTPRLSYKHADGSDRLYSMQSEKDCQWAYGSKYAKLRARLFLWSNLSVKTILANIRDGKLPFKFKFNERADETFNQQMYSEQLNSKTGRFEQVNGIENHLWDCFAMSLTMALMAKCFVPEASNINN